MNDRYAYRAYSKSRFQYGFSKFSAKAQPILAEAFKELMSAAAFVALFFSLIFVTMIF